MTGDSANPMSPAALPSHYRALLVRFDAVCPDHARVARLAVARHHAAGTPYDLDFLRTLVERAERQTGAGPVTPEPYTLAHLRDHVEGSFPSVRGLWPALTDAHPYLPGDVIDLVRQLVARLASWGLHRRDVRPATPGPDNPDGADPHDHVRAIGGLTTGAARLAKDHADQAAGRDPEGTARRLTRDHTAFERALDGARRVLSGGPYIVRTPPVPRVGDHRSWWAVTGRTGKRRFQIKRGSLPVAVAERHGVLGPFVTRRGATQAGTRATATADDHRVGLFAGLSVDTLFPEVP